VAWVAPSDGLLAMDRNHDGRINDGSELFGSATRLPDGSRARDGFAAMAALDSNHDGKLSAADHDFKDLRVWVDANSNGQSDAGELKTLAELGITELNLQAQPGKEIDHGNLLGLTASYRREDGSSAALADVWLTGEGTRGSQQAAAVSTLPPLTELLAPAATPPLPEAPLPMQERHAESPAALFTHTHQAWRDDGWQQLPLI